MTTVKFNIPPLPPTRLPRSDCNKFVAYYRNLPVDALLNDVKHIYATEQNPRRNVNRLRALKLVLRERKDDMLHHPEAAVFPYIHDDDYGAIGALQDVYSPHDESADGELERHRQKLLGMHCAVLQRHVRALPANVRALAVDPVLAQAIAEIGELRREEMRIYEEQKTALREASVIQMIQEARDEEPAEVVTIDTGRGGKQKFHIAPDTTKVASPRAGGGGCPGCGVCGACSAEGRERIRKRFAAANLAYEAARNADEDAPKRAPKRARTK
jgi:hypothetical protein